MRQTLGQLGFVLVVALVSVPLLFIVFTVHANAPQLEVPLFLGTLALGLIVLAATWMMRLSRRLRFFGLWCTLGCMLVAMCFAIAHGWFLLANGIYAALALSIAAGMFILRQKVKRIASSVFEDMASDAAAISVWDDGQAIVVYPDRRKLGLYTGYLASLLLFFSLLAVVLHASSIALLAILLLCLLLGIFLLLSISRLFMRGPAVVVNAEGIVDNVTLIATGLGMIRWTEIAVVAGFGQVSQAAFLSRRSLIIEIVNARELRARQPFIKRCLLALMSSSVMPSPVRIREFLLPMTVDELLDQVKQYLEAHGGDSVHVISADHK